MTSAKHSIHIAMCLRVLRDALVTASERAMVKAINTWLVVLIYNRDAFLSSMYIVLKNIFLHSIAYLILWVYYLIHDVWCQSFTARRGPMRHPADLVKCGCEKHYWLRGVAKLSSASRYKFIIKCLTMFNLLWNYYSL